MSNFIWKLAATAFVILFLKAHAWPEEMEGYAWLVYILVLPALFGVGTISWQIANEKKHGHTETRDLLTLYIFWKLFFRGGLAAIAGFIICGGLTIREMSKPQGHWENDAVNTSANISKVSQHWVPAEQDQPAH